MIYRHELTVPDDAIDRNGHVNNVSYLQWMQDVAILHSDSVGATRAVREAGGMWVARSHHIEYLKPAFAQEDIVLLTWVANAQRVKSLRRYRFVRKSDDALIARGETEWVYVDQVTGRPQKIPGTVMQLFTIVGEDEEPS